MGQGRRLPLHKLPATACHKRGKRLPNLQDLFLHILEDTEAHIDFPETQLALVRKVGKHNHLQTQLGT